MIVDLGALPWRVRAEEFRRLLSVPFVSIWLAYKWGGAQQSVRTW